MTGNEMNLSRNPEPALNSDAPTESCGLNLTFNKTQLHTTSPQEIRLIS